MREATAAMGGDVQEQAEGASASARIDARIKELNAAARAGKKPKRA